MHPVVLRKWLAVF